jgi:hypothetical protein
MRESHRILQENTGNPWNWKQYSDRNFFGFFRLIRVNFLCVPAGNHRKKSGNFPGRDIASMFPRFPVFSDRNRPVLIDMGCQR